MLFISVSKYVRFIKVCIMFKSIWLPFFINYSGRKSDLGAVLFLFSPLLLLYFPLETIGFPTDEDIYRFLFPILQLEL